MQVLLCMYLKGSEYNSLVFDVVDDESLAWLNESRADVFNVGHSDDKTIFPGTGALNLTEKLLLNRVHQLKNEAETVQLKISQAVLQVKVHLIFHARLIKGLED